MPVGLPKCFPSVPATPASPKVRTSRFPSFQTTEMNESAQRALEGEVQARFGEAIELCQEEAPGCQRGQFRSQRGKAAGNQVGIDEMDHAGVLGQKF